MQIDLNGKPRPIEGGTTISKLIEELGLANQACAVEVNKRLVRKARYPEHELADGDHVEIVTLVGGG